MLFVTSLDTSNFMLIFLGQILVFLILLSFYFLIRKNTKKYEDKTKKEIENEKNIEKLKKLRNEI